MKLSQAIEHMLVTGRYSRQNEYMCHVLSNDGLDQFKSDVEDMVLSIRPQSYRGVPLICALHESRFINMNEMTWQAMFDYTKQLYCWWVFDLKRKGL